MEQSRHIARFYRVKMLAATDYAERESARINYELYLFASGGLGQ